MSNQILTYIISAKAGKGHPEQVQTLIERAASSSHLASNQTVDVQITQHHGHSTQIARACVEDATLHGNDHIVYVLGGDGTAHEVAGALVHSPVAMGVLPSGTANDFARALYGGHAQTKTLLTRSFNPTVQKIDTYEVNGEVGLNVASLGFDTVVLEATYKLLKRFPKLGVTAYLGGVLSTFFQTKSTPMPVAWGWIDQDGREVRGEDYIALAAIANSRFYGGGYQPAPRALLRDGWLNVIVVRRVGMTKFVPLLLKYRKGTHLGDPSVADYLVKEGFLESTTEEPILANLDGEIIRSHRLDFKILPRSLILALPQGVELPTND